jgi:hypothetical protein
MVARLSTSAIVSGIRSRRLHPIGAQKLEKQVGKQE